MKILHPSCDADVSPAEAGTPYVQREFARRVTAVEALKTAQRASLAELDALFATLQHRAFRGELFGVPYGVPPSGGRAHERKGA